MEGALISIFCLTYNHAPYIRDAIEGFLMQKTEYPYHIFIFDDASDDGTSEIVKEYQDEYPDKINVYRPEQNTYRKKFRKELLLKLKKKYLTGKYVAFCEGDDCWIDSDKLQRQVKFMEMHPECVMTVHDAWWIDYRTGERKKHSAFNETKYLETKDIILKGAGGLPTASFVITRDVYFGDINFPKCDVGDWPMQLYAITKGKIYYFDKKMSIYRRMHTGSWSERYQNDEVFSMCHRLEMIDFLKLYDIYTERRFHLYVRERINSYFYNSLYMNNDCYEMYMYEEKCMEVSRRTNGKYDFLIERIKQVSNLLQNEIYFDEKMCEYIKTHKYLVVMGMGKYSKNITHCLQDKKIEVTGYILSNDQKLCENNKTVWRIKDYPYSWEKTCLIIALHPRWQEEAEKSLKDGGVYSYYAPFWVEDYWFCRK